MPLAGRAPKTGYEDQNGLQRSKRIQDSRPDLEERESTIWAFDGREAAYVKDDRALTDVLDPSWHEHGVIELQNHVGMRLSVLANCQDMIVD